MFGTWSDRNFCLKQVICLSASNAKFQAFYRGKNPEQGDLVEMFEHV